MLRGMGSRMGTTLLTSPVKKYYQYKKILNNRCEKGILYLFISTWESLLYFYLYIQLEMSGTVNLLDHVHILLGTLET
jgi:hypothetical protein